jgi:acyl carrier protein
MNDNSQVLEQLVEDVSKWRERSDITQDSTLVEIGVDSLNVIELIMICESKYSNIKNPELIKFDEFTTLKSLHEQLLELAAA